MIKLLNISKSYTANENIVSAVKNANLHVAKSEIVGIVGTSGAGKSTILNCINLLEMPDSGEVIVDGVNLLSLDKKGLQKKRKEIGMIFQQFNLFTQRNVYKNVAYTIKNVGMTKAQINDRVNYLLDIVGISDKKDAFPSQLSGGQKQRVAIARALASNPKILLCDEATSALDPETTQSILRLLKDINQKFGITIVLITHEPAVVKNICDRVILMDSGEIIETSKTVDFFTNPKTELGEKFVGSLIENHPDKDKIMPYLYDTKSDSKIYQLMFLGDNTSKSYISEASKKFDVDIAILFGNIEFITDQTVGKLIVKIQGSDEEISITKKYFEDNGIDIREVKKHV